MSDEIASAQAAVDDLEKAAAEARANLVRLQAEKRQQGSGILAEAVAKAHAAVVEAQKIADEYGLTFNFDLAYGMGGTYYPKNAAGDWDESGAEEGWVSSSAMC